MPDHRRKAYPRAHEGLARHGRRERHLCQRRPASNSGLAGKDGYASLALLVFSQISRELSIFASVFLVFGL